LDSSQYREEYIKCLRTLKDLASEGSGVHDVDELTLTMDILWNRMSDEDRAACREASVKINAGLDKTEKV
jgi:hypothetical protein